MVIQKIFFIFFLLVQSSFAKEQVRGFLENLSIYSRQYKSKYNVVLQKALKHPLKMEQNITPADLKLSSKYLQYIVFASESAYIGLYDGKDICKFMALAINDLISPVDKIVFEFNKSRTNRAWFFNP